MWSFFIAEGTVDPADIEDLFDQLEDYSDSGPDADTISIGSTPKPSLKPFFCSSRNLLHEARSVVAAAAAAKAQSKYFFKITVFYQKKRYTQFNVHLYNVRLITP